MILIYGKMILISDLNMCNKQHVDGFVEDCSNSSVLAMQLLQSCNKPSMYS